jgi:uncharacterized protein
VILIDANLPIYAVDSISPRYERAKGWLEEVLSGNETVAFSWMALLAFLRRTTKRGLFQRPLSVTEAMDLVDEWLAQPVAAVMAPAGKHPRILRDLLLLHGSGGNLTADAHLAALAMEHGAELCSADTDFSRFPGLRWRNPLAG